MYFPVCLDIRERRCIVVGGGRVAERKAKGLLEHGGLVRVISPDITPDLNRLKEEGRLKWLNRDYQDGDLAEAFLVIAATDDTSVQARVFAEAEMRRIMVNVADVPKWCNFILPATARRGDLAISVSTGGKSPALAKRLRQELEDQFGEEYSLLTEILGNLRPVVLALKKSHTENQELFSQLLHDNFPAWIKDRDWQQITRHVKEVLAREAQTAQLDNFLAQAPWNGAKRGTS